MKKLLLLATISIFLSACASEKPIYDYQLIPPQTTVKINPNLSGNNNSINNNNNTNTNNKE